MITLYVKCRVCGTDTTLQSSTGLFGSAADFCPSCESEHITVRYSNTDASYNRGKLVGIVEMAAIIIISSFLQWWLF